MRFPSHFTNFSITVRKKIVDVRSPNKNPKVFFVLYLSFKVKKKNENKSTK